MEILKNFLFNCVHSAGQKATTEWLLQQMLFVWRKSHKISWLIRQFLLE